MYTVKKQSSWKYKTSASGSVALGLAAFEGGHIVLLDPNGKTEVLHYRAVGIGPGYAARLPNSKKLPVKLRGKSGGAGGSTEDTWSRGKVSVLSGCSRDELTLEDFRGLCVIQQVSISFIKGRIETFMLMGLDPGHMSALSNIDPSSPNVSPSNQYFDRLYDTAKVAITSESFSYGLQASIGYAALAGMVK